MNIEDLIKNLRETDQYIETIFSQGGCYKFHLFLKSIFPSCIALINKERDHIATYVNGKYYDITGELDEINVSESEFIMLKGGSLKMAESWSFSGRMFLSIGECKNCEEPILV